jgi:hypothetical protein
VIQLQLLRHSQESGEVHLEVSYEVRGSATVVIDHDNVPALLMTILNALRVGEYPSDVLCAAAMSCAAMLSQSPQHVADRAQKAAGLEAVEHESELQLVSMGQDEKRVVDPVPNPPPCDGMIYHNDRWYDCTMGPSHSGPHRSLEIEGARREKNS